MKPAKDEWKVTKENLEKAERLLKFLESGGDFGDTYIKRKVRAAKKSKAYWLGFRLGLKQWGWSISKIAHAGFSQEDIADAKNAFILATRLGEKNAPIGFMRKRSK